MRCEDCIHADICKFIEVIDDEIECKYYVTINILYDIYTRLFKKGE